MIKKPHCLSTEANQEWEDIPAIQYHIESDDQSAPNPIL